MQDLNEVQFELVRQLAGPHTAVMAVGDPHQSIYGWRGAQPSLMQEDFPAAFPGSACLKLSTNFRSGRCHCASASGHSFPAWSRAVSPCQAAHRHLCSALPGLAMLCASPATQCAPTGALCCTPCSRCSTLSQVA